MESTKYTTPSGYLLPSIHSSPPFFTYQINPQSQSMSNENWTRLILSYGRHRKLFTLSIADAENKGSEWDEIFRNERINRRLLPQHLSKIIEYLVAKGHAVYEPPKQTKEVLLYWNTPEQWSNVLYDWAVSTGQVNTILTYYEISEPPVSSPLSGIPHILLRRAINILVKSGKAQIITVADGEGVKIFQR